MLWYNASGERGTWTGEVRAGYWWGKLGKRDHLEDLGVYWRIILKWIFRKWGGGVGWIHLAQDRDRCPALVNDVINLRIS
jgi:hypothetical protein